MWKAVLIVCSLTSPDKCETWVDAIGPSKSYEQCINRALEMNEHAFTHLRDYKGEPAWKGRSYQCNKLPNGTL
jgi:hypothetical protein